MYAIEVVIICGNKGRRNDTRGRKVVARAVVVAAFRPGERRRNVRFYTAHTAELLSQR